MTLRKVVAGWALVCFVGLSVCPGARAAEVYYLGGAGGGPAINANPSYPMSTRLQDLVDFTSKRPYEERSGVITGTLTQEVSHNDIGGNTSKSFLRRGDDYLTELNLNMREKVWSNYQLESQLFLRKTDNNRIEPHRTVRIKDAQVKLYNDINMFEGGDFYADFSPYSLSASLEGFHAMMDPASSRKYQFVAARTAEADAAASRFQRNVVGFKMDQFLFQESETVSDLRTGWQVVSIQDDSSSLERTSSTLDLANVVLSTDGELALYQSPFGMNWEAAHSFYQADTDSPAGDNDVDAANAVRVQPRLNFDKIRMRYLFELVQPKFYTDQGSAATDKVRHQISADVEFSRRVSMTLSENYYWDRLSGSNRTKRTVNDEKDLTFNLRPFESRESFTLRPYIRYATKDSDDAANSAEGVTRTLGFGISDTLDDQTSLGFDYEYRSYKDEAGAGASSDYFHRVGMNVSREQQLFDRRLYYSLGPSIDLRSTKTDDDKDANLNVALNGQYDISPVLMMRAGSQYAMANGARPTADYDNHRAFAEVDRSFSDGATHFILRTERNHFAHEDGAQSYTEQRYISKLLVRF